MRLRLTGRTRKGKNRVHQFGKDWQVIRTEEKVHCLNDEKGMFIFPLTSPENARWVKVQNDQDFIIEVVNEDADGTK